MSVASADAMERLIAPRPIQTTPRPEPISELVEVLEHDLVSSRYHRLVLRHPEMARRATAGQFVMLSVPESMGERILLPRPMAVHRRDRAAGTLEVIFNVVGRGTRALSSVAQGDRFLVTGPLGRGFEVPGEARRLLVIGRGIGVCAVMGALEDARDAGVQATAVLSASAPETVIGLADCVELGADAIAVTDHEGTSAVDVLKARLQVLFDDVPPDAIMVCGSNRLTALASDLSARWGVAAQVSLEAHMACGLGYCHGCAAPTAQRADREGPLVCVDGPVFDVIASGTA